jgi:diacylglycerol kinase family enzyme
MSRRIAVVLNPNALGVRRARGLGDELRRVLGDAGEVAVTRTPAELGAAVRRFPGDGIGIVAACGGDGTNLSTLTELVHAYGASLPTFAILRGGTVNTIAHNLGIGGRPVDVLSRLVAAARSSDEIPTVGQDLLVVNGMYGFLFASLMGARFLEAYYGGLRPGPTWAGLLAARTVASSLVQGRFARWLFAPTELRMVVDGEAADVPGCRLLVASVVRDVGIGMRVTWQAGRQPQRFHLVASGLSTTSMALQLHRVLRGQALAGAPHLDLLAQSARIEFAQPCTYTLDGDLFRAPAVDIAVGPRVWIARP